MEQSLYNMVLSDFKKVKAVVLDVDGVLTDGRVLVNEQGEQWRTFHTRDGYAIQLAVKSGLPIWIITGGRSVSTEHRIRFLGVEEVFLGVEDKQTVLFQLAEKYGISLEDILYMGDDIPDLFPMRQVGLPVCPRNAAEEIKAVSRYVSSCDGGQGAVRDVLEKVLKLQGTWPLGSDIKSI